MRKLAFALALVLAGASGASAQYQQPYGGYGTGSNQSNHYVQGYIRNNGTYVAPHYQTNPNGTQFDNYGTRGNLNPYTGQYGTRTPHY
jgi:hypothetical protein